MKQGEANKPLDGFNQAFAQERITALGRSMGFMKRAQDDAAENGDELDVMLCGRPEYGFGGHSAQLQRAVGGIDCV